MLQYFTGNRDRNNIKQHRLFPVAHARFLRILPKGWHRWISMRVELNGCPAGKYNLQLMLYVSELLLNQYIQVIGQLN